MIKYFSYLLLASPLVACDGDFAPYAEVRGMRVLAAGADKPDLAPGETAQLSALVTADADLSWSWCPFAGPSSRGYPCLVTHQEMQDFADEFFPDPISIPNFYLGDDEVADLENSVPPDFYRAACEVLIQRQNLPEGVRVPECGSRFPLQVTLETTNGDAAITSVFEVQLLLDDTAKANENPTLEGVRARSGNEDVELLESSPTPLRRGEAYELELAIGADQAEEFEIEGEARHESLVATWFYEAGSYESSRTTYLFDTIPIEEFRVNTWTAPTAQEFSNANLTLYMVVRDGRGGVGWITREIALVNP